MGVRALECRQLDPPERKQRRGREGQCFTESEGETGGNVQDRMYREEEEYQNRGNMHVDIGHFEVYYYFSQATLVFALPFLKIISGILGICIHSKLEQAS